MDDNILKTILSMKFKSLIKTHSLVILLMEFKSHSQNPWFKLIANYLSKTQFTLAISKAQFSLVILKAQFSLTILKAQFSLAIYQ